MLLASKNNAITLQKQSFYKQNALTLFSRRNIIEKQRDNTCDARKGLTQINKTQYKHCKSQNYLHKPIKSSNFALIIDHKQ